LILSVFHLLPTAAGGHIWQLPLRAIEGGGPLRGQQAAGEGKELQLRGAAVTGQ